MVFPYSCYKLCKEVGFPPGVVNVVTADFLSTPSIGTVLCSHPLVRHVSFFGSTDVGRCCIAPNRIFVQSEIYDEFIRILIEKVTPLKAGNPMDKSSSYSGLTDQRRYDHVAQIVDLTIKQGAKLTYQAEKVPECGPYHFPLTILTECKTSMDICQYEIFGPVFAIYKYIHESVRFEQEAEVFEAMNQGIYGLASYVYSAEIDQVLRTVDELEYALVSVNDIHPFEMLVPFGGLKESGSGNLLGLRSIYGFLDESSVIINHE
ncbi:Aldehyde dehydrogenase family 1 member A3 [Thelohanellus kitauei]|uniref:Aldehyde dehydrogenase family 1 member A3 n=1 Tax=Thelohanellus kitauei TaxID=669202 RepID=A0A0C2LZX4_THEKT|nr:Aldehyde dehydrogenase family 1 member A3 [Thelohanellus kitauei]